MFLIDADTNADRNPDRNTHTNAAANTQIRMEIQSDAKWVVGHLLFIQWMLLIKPLTNDEHGGRLERDGEKDNQ